MEKLLNCDFGLGLCKGIERMFEAVETAEWRPLTIDQVLYKGLENSFEFFKVTNPKDYVALIEDRKSLNNFLSNLSTQGTGGVTVGELQAALETTLVKLIIIGFDATVDFTPIPKPVTTTLPTKKNTTQWTKVTYSKLFKLNV